MRKIPYSILKKINLLTRPEYSLAKRKGARFLLNKYNWIDNRLLCFRSYEKANLQAMLSLIDEKNIDYFFDIGANIGYFSTLISKKSRVTHTYAYEPMKRNFYQLCANILLNGLSQKVSCFNIALGDEDKISELWYNDRSTGIATLDRSATPRATKDYSICEMIECKIFDALVDMANQKVLVKIDVEGFEKHTLAGMQEFFKRNAVYLFIEINRDADALLEQLNTMGFERLDISADDYVFSNIAGS